MAHHGHQGRDHHRAADAAASTRRSALFHAGAPQGASPRSSCAHASPCLRNCSSRRPSARPISRVSSTTYASLPQAVRAPQRRFLLPPRRCGTALALTHSTKSRESNHCSAHG